MARFSSVAMQTTGAGSNASSPSSVPHLFVSPNSSDEEDNQQHIHSEGTDQDTALLLPPIVAPAGGEVKEQPFVISPRRRVVASKMLMAASINDNDLSDKANDSSCELLDGAERCKVEHHNERRPECYRLCTYEEAPPYLQHNPFIRTGYRVNFSFSLCVESLYRLHNESWNIWTHGFGFALFLFLAAATMQQLTWDTPLEPLVFFMFFVTVECSMLSSTIFHAFNCHSPSTYKWTCRFDYSSISLLLVGAYAPMLYYGFMCEPFWQAIYLTGLFLLGTAGVLISFIPIFSTPQYTSFRTGVFVALGWSTILPLPHMLYIHGPALVWEVARWELLVGVIYTTGAVLYAKRIPERWSPGQYDTSFMCSHSLWHCFTIAGALTQLYACVQVYHIFISGLMGSCVP